MDNEEFTLMTISLMIILSVVTTFLNSICIIIITKSKALLKRPSTLLILNLLVVHWLQGVLCFPFYAAKKAPERSFHSGRVICDGFRFTYMATFYAAIMAVFLISVDRLIATCFVIRYREIVSKKRVISVLVLAWIYVIVLCTVPFYNHDPDKTFEVKTNQSSTTQNSTNSAAFNHKCLYRQSQEWTILMLVFNCAVPYLLIVVFYYKILMTIKVIQHRTERARTMTTTTLTTPTMENGTAGRNRTLTGTISASATPQNERTATWRDNERKQFNTMTRLCIIMGISYLFFWLPSVIYFVTLRACPERCFPKGWGRSDEEKLVGFFTKFLAFLDAAAAPIIYCIISGEFRKHIPCHAEERQTLIDESRTNLSRTHNQNYHIHKM